MGVGNVGKFVAHALRGIPNPPPVTLLFSRWDRLNEWNESRQQLTVITEGDSESREGFDAEISIPRIRFHGKEVGIHNHLKGATDGTSTGTAAEESDTPKVLSGESLEPISSLIVCSKAPFVLQALSAVKHRLHKDSVICFMLNGMGTVDEVNREIFPDPETRPHYMYGINSHGMHSVPGDPFATVHAGFGTISLGILPHERDRSPTSPYKPTTKFKACQSDPVEYNPRPTSHTAESDAVRWTPNHRYLLRTLLRTPVLTAAAFSPPDLLQLQLEKLAINCVINPLTVLLDARNGSILYNYNLTRTLRLLLAEISLVIRSLPELASIPNVSARFDAGRLETRVVGVANATRDNISSMLADARAGRETEIEYLNGWIVRRGEELGMRCVCNYMMVTLVKGKANLVKLEMSEGVPFVEDDDGRGDVLVRRDGGNGST